MQFQSLNIDINRLTRVRDGLRVEVSELMKERDKILEEIRSQRDGKTEVQSEATALKSLYDFVQEQITIAEKTRDKSLNDFSLTYDKQTVILEGLKKIIESKAKIADSFNKTESDVIKMQEKLFEAKKELDQTSLRTGEFLSEAEKREIKIQKQIKKSSDILEKIEEEKRFIIAEKESLRELELKIKRDHERLDAHEKRVRESLNHMEYAD